MFSNERATPSFDTEMYNSCFDMLPSRGVVRYAPELSIVSGTEEIKQNKKETKLKLEKNG